MASPGRPDATTLEYVESIALREPTRVAFADEAGRTTYEALHRELLRATQVLHGLGVRKGHRVAVGMPQFQWGLALLLAAEHLGAVTLSFQHQGDVDEELVFGLAQWVFSDHPQRVPPGVRFVPVDEAFRQRMDAVPARAAVPKDPCTLEEPQRIARTSGSSGRSKFMLMSRHSQETWIAGVARSAGLADDSRVLIAGPLVINSHFARASACLRLGATIVELPALVRGEPITHVFALPALLERVIEALGPRYAAARPAKVCTLGGPVPPLLRERALRTFGGPLLSRYGANEAGEICADIDPRGVGVLTPGVEVRVVDPLGRDLPIGEAGVIAVRTPGMVDGYIGNEAATREVFRDGWFHTGDWGALLGPRTLQLLGRHDTLVNVGGIKAPAYEIEDQVRSAVSPKACAALACNFDGGQTHLGIALVMDSGASRDEARRLIGERVRLNMTVGVRVLFLDELPVMATGKVDRVALLRLFEAPPPGAL